MLALVPDEKMERSVLDRFLMLHIRDISGGEEDLPDNQGDGISRDFFDSKGGKAGCPSLRDGP